MEYFNISPPAPLPGQWLYSSWVFSHQRIRLYHCVMVSHQNGPVLTVSSHIASPDISTAPLTVFMASFYVFSSENCVPCAPPEYKRPINLAQNFTIWFGSQNFFTDNKNYSLSPCVPPQVSPGLIYWASHLLRWRRWGTRGAELL